MNIRMLNYFGYQVREGKWLLDRHNLEALAKKELWGGGGPPMYKWIISMNGFIHTPKKEYW